jgi:hypothetical protein
MAASVDSKLRAIFCAVPAPMRVDPAISSGGVSSTMATSANRSSGVSLLLAMAMVAAPGAGLFDVLTA